MCRRRTNARAPPAFPNSEGTIHDQVELRVAHGRYGRHRDGTPSADGRSALWIRLPRELDRSAAGLAIVADWVPSGIGQALGRWAGGNSLDNTIRILDLVPTDWVLCDIQVHGIAKGFGHGRSPSVERGRAPDGDGQPVAHRARTRLTSHGNLLIC